MHCTTQNPPAPASIAPTANDPHTNAYTLRPYIAMMFKNIRRLGVMGRKVGEWRSWEWMSEGVGELFYFSRSPKSRNRNPLVHAL